MRAQFVFHEVWIGLRRNLTMTIALIVVVAISLSLLGTGLLFVKQVDNTRTYWQGKVQLSVYLCSKTQRQPQCAKNGPVTAEPRSTQIEQELKSNPGRQREVSSTTAAGLPAVQAGVRGQPVAGQVHSAGRDPGLLRGPAQEHRGRRAAGRPGGRRRAPGVDQVVQDSAILNKFYKLLDGARNAVVIIAIILIIAAILLVANTIRLSAFNRRRETSIMRLVGRVQLLRPAAVPGRGHDRRADRLAGRDRAADRGQVAAGWTGCSSTSRSTCS